MQTLTLMVETLKVGDFAPGGDRGRVGARVVGDEEVSDRAARSSLYLNALWRSAAHEETARIKRIEGDDCERRIVRWFVRNKEKSLFGAGVGRGGASPLELGVENVPAFKKSGEATGDRNNEQHCRDNDS